MKRINDVISDEQSKRKEATGLTWGKIIELGIIMAETKSADLAEAREQFRKEQ